MTIKELMAELVTLMDYGVAPDTPVVVRDMLIDHDPDVDISYYDEDAKCVCLGIY